MHALKKIVKLDDLKPVRVLRAGGLAMLGGDRRLHSIGTDSASKGLLDKQQFFANLAMIPAAAILLFENDKVAGRIDAGITTCIVKEHQRNQSRYFRWRSGRHQRSHQAA